MSLDGNRGSHLLAISLIGIQLLAAGCGTRQQARSTTRLGGGIMIAGGAIVVIGGGIALGASDDLADGTGNGHGEGTGVAIAMAGLAVVIVGAVIGLSGASGLDMHPAAACNDAASCDPGFLTVISEVEMSVWMDGANWGTTPLYRRSLPAGHHSVELRSPDTGDVRLRQDVEITAGHLERIVL